MDYAQLMILGSVAGFTIYLGLPLAVMQGVGERGKSFLNATAIGILMFLLVEVFGHAWEPVEAGAMALISGQAMGAGGLLNMLAFFGGLGIGILGLAFYEARYISAQDAGPTLVQETSAGQLAAQKMATMIALAIGAHNFSEGLAIGQSYAAGSVGLALILVIGFGVHNATEGFGIASPLIRLTKRPSIRFLAGVGLLGGGPTLAGTLVGSISTSTFVYILFLTAAGGALIYVALLMYSSGRRRASNRLMMAGIFAGLCVGFLSDLLVTLGGA